MSENENENKKIKLMIEVDEKLVCEGFERPFTEEERNILIRAIGNGRLCNTQDDCISRSALKEDFDVAFFNDEDDYKKALRIIDSVPSVPLPDFKDGYKQAILDGKTNFARQEGEWINHRNDYEHNIADCSLCGKTMQWHDEDEDGVPRYCWYCGAPMKGVKKNEITFDDYLKEQLKDPEFRKEWEKLLDEEKQKGDAK